MKIVHLTAGTGNFHCGTCLRDHALVTALNRLGHDAVMAPLYLPFVLDHNDQHTDQDIFLGGINVYLQSLSSFFRHTPRWIDRLFDGTWLLRKASSRAGMTRASELGRLTLSLIKGDAGDQVKEVRRLAKHMLSQERPNVICLSNALLIGLARELKEQLKVPIVCTLQGEDTFLDALPEPYRDQCWLELQKGASEVDTLIAVSQYHGNIMQQRLHLSDDRLHVVHNGIELSDYSQATNSPATPTIGYLARLCPSKGLHTLIDAFIEITKRGALPDAQLHIAGAMTPADQTYTNQQIDRLKQAGVFDRVTIETNVSLKRKAQLLQSFSVLSVPATYGESFGLYVLEAWASGVPVVQPDHGAFSELMAIAQGGILCQADDAIDLADSLQQLLTDDDQRQSLARAGHQGVIDYFNTDRMAQQFAEVLKKVTHGV